METLLIYTLTVYFLFHVVSRSDFMACLRKWAQRVLPTWVVYPLTCAFCWTFHAGWLFTLLLWWDTGHLTFSVAYLFVAPVINLLVDFVVQTLIRNNTPPVFKVGRDGGESLMGVTNGGLTWTTTTTGGDEQEKTEYRAGPNSSGGPINIPSVWVEHPRDAHVSFESMKIHPENNFPSPPSVPNV